MPCGGRPAEPQRPHLHSPCCQLQRRTRSQRSERMRASIAGGSLRTPYTESVERLQLKTPSELTRATFLDLVKSLYNAAGFTLLEAAVFQEPHKRIDTDGNRLLHLSCLTKCAGQHTWTQLAQAFRRHGVAMDFATNIKTWFDGVVYGSVPSDHKPRGDLDADPLLWAFNGASIPCCEVLPPWWLGWRELVRKTFQSADVRHLLPGEHHHSHLRLDVGYRDGFVG